LASSPEACPTEKPKSQKTIAAIKSACKAHGI